MQYTSLPDGFTIQELDASHLEQFNALLRYAFQVTEEELVQVGWQEDEIKQSKFPILESAHVLGCFEGKTLAAQIAVYPMQVNVEGALLDTGFVTGVATYPEYAGIGLMSTLRRSPICAGADRASRSCARTPSPFTVTRAGRSCRTK